MKDIVVSFKDAQAIMDYFSSRPYAEVYKLVPIIMTAKTVDQVIKNTADPVPENDGEKTIQSGAV